MPDIQVGDLVRFKLPSREQQLLIDTLGKKQAEGVWLVVDRGAKILTLQQGNTKKVAPDRYLRKI
jgi:hypothetical protein